MPNQTERRRIVVVGGGYAGTLAANRLCKRDDIDITLVNPRPVFIDRIRLHQFASDSGPATVAYSSLLRREVEFLVDTAERIDTVARRVRLASNRDLDYDYLIYAVGSTGMVPTAIPGANEHAETVADWASAQRIRTVLGSLPADAPITVVGGGLTGIETAAELADQGRTVTLLCGGALGPSLSTSARRSVSRWMSRRGVTVVEAAIVNEVRQDGVSLDSHRSYPSALTIWAAGLDTPDLAAVSGLPTDETGRLLTDETLTCINNERVIAAGDAVAPSGRPLRMSSQAAAPLGAHAADTVLNRISGTDPAGLDFGFTGSCVSLGRKAAVRQFARKDDSPLNFYVGGRIATAYKELTCKVGILKIRLEARRPGSFPWPKGGRRFAQSRTENPVSNKPEA